MCRDVAAHEDLPTQVGLSGCSNAIYSTPSTARQFRQHSRAEKRSPFVRPEQHALVTQYAEIGDAVAAAVDQNRSGRAGRRQGRGQSGARGLAQSPQTALPSVCFN